jgi:hypothetical protein
MEWEVEIRLKGRRVIRTYLTNFGLARHFENGGTWNRFSLTFAPGLDAHFNEFESK